MIVNIYLQRGNGNGEVLAEKFSRDLKKRFPESQIETSDVGVVIFKHNCLCHQEMQKVLEEVDQMAGVMFAHWVEK